jgi:tRNA threonylcarbamoyladenosine biosynthesis protein TsaE
VIVALSDLAEVERFGAAIAQRLQPGDVVALSGGLGAGKTTLARAMIAALGYAGEVPSPSFAIFELYEPPALRLPVVHADFYRLADPHETAQLGLDDYRRDAVMIAEWPENAGGFAHDPACLTIALDYPREIGATGRIAIVEPGRDWLGRLP